MRRARPLLGTFVEITLHAHGKGSDALFSAAFAEIGRIQKLMTAHETEGSDLARLALASGAGETVAVAAETAALLRRALAFAEETDGAFDPVAAGTRLVRAGRRPAFAASPPHPIASWRDLHIGDDNTLTAARPLAVDLGGIAKGYAVDRAAALLETAGVSATINAGGDMRFIGDAPRLASLRGPEADSAKLWTARDFAHRALASSATTGSHDISGGDLVVTATGSRVLPADLAVTIFAADCTTADALTKAALFLPHAALQVVLLRHGAQAVLLDKTGPIATLG